MRLLAVIHTPRSPHSAVYLSYAALAAFLEPHGHALSTLTPDDFPWLTRLHGRWLPLVYPFLVDRWLRPRGRTFDLVLFHSYAGWRANLRSRRPFASVTVFHGLEPLHYAVLALEMEHAGRRLKLPFRVLHGWVLPRLIRLSCRRSDRVLCLNRAEADYLHRHHWAAPESIVVYAHGAPDAFYVSREFSREASTLCFVGQWLERKGIRYLTQAFAAVARARPSLRLCCAGTLADPDRVRRDFAPEVRSRVDVHPRVSRTELARLYEEADVFVLPTLFEGFSLAVIEAMAAALPILTTPVGAVPDLLESGVNAMLVPVRDARSLEHALSQLLDDAALRERLGRAAQRTARDFESNRVHARLLSILQEVPRTQRLTSSELVMPVVMHYLSWLVGLARAETQTSEAERACLARHAAGRRRLVEIGVWHGVTTTRLRAVMAADGILVAVDPYPRGRLGVSFPRLIARSEVARVVNGTVRWLRMTGSDAARAYAASSAEPVDFVFIDGDHTYEGLRGDWEGWSGLVAAGGVVALHDSRVTEDRPIHDAGSVVFTREVIARDPRFAVADCVETLTVLRRVP
jgi:glycosyltransferase involved in cell wall biosynthesis